MHSTARMAWRHFEVDLMVDLIIVVRLLLLLVRRRRWSASRAGGQVDALAEVGKACCSNNLEATVAKV